MRVLESTLLFALALASTSAEADRSLRALSKLEGYTVVAVTQVDGEFKGCDWDRPIKLQNGMTLKCRTYSYSYSYAPEAAVFAKSFQHQGKSFAQIRLLVEGEVYDMGVEILKN
jgi:hypothetical protein